MKRLTICLLNALFHPFQGGGEKHMHELAKKLARKGVRIVVVTSKLPGTPAHEKMDGFEIYRIPAIVKKVPGLYPPPATFSTGVLAALRELDKKYDFDIVHLHSRWFADWSIAACLFRKLYGKKFVLTIHNARPVGISPAYTIIGSLYDLNIGKMVFKCTDKLIAVSEFARHDIAKYGIPKTKIKTIHNGIDTHSFKPPTAGERAEARKTFNLSQKDFAIFWVGRIIEQKGLQYLLRAMPAVLRSAPQAKLILVGHGNQQKKLQKLVQKLRLSKNVLFAGTRNGTELHKALHAADAFVLPSVWEVFPIALLEAMASGLPSVATDAGGNAEAVRDGIEGFIVPKRNPVRLAVALSRLENDPALRKRMAKRARERVVKEFDWEKQAQKVLAFYRSLTT